MFGSIKKVNLGISYFYATLTEPTVQVKMKEGKVKEMRQSRWRWRRDRGICGERGCGGGYVKDTEGE